MQINGLQNGMEINLFNFKSLTTAVIVGQNTGEKLGLNELTTYNI